MVIAGFCSANSIASPSPLAYTFMSPTAGINFETGSVSLILPYSKSIIMAVDAMGLLTE
jgi:hypothetical protein